MGVNAEGKISLSVELQNFKDIASSLKKGLSDQLKQVPLDIEFSDKSIEKQATEAVKRINEILSKSRVKYLDLSSILPNFVKELNKEGIPEETRKETIIGFETALTNLRDIGIKQDYSKLKGFSGDDLKTYISDLNDVVDILNTIEGLTQRQKQGLLTTVLPSLSDLNGRGQDAAKKEYTKGAKKLEAILKLSDDYSDVLQYGVNPTATKTALNEINIKAQSGQKLSKKDSQDLLAYLLRGKFLGLEFGKKDDKDLANLDFDYLLNTAKEGLDKATIEYINKRSTAYFTALDNIYNSSAQEISYSDLTKGIQNTTNQKMQSLFDAEISEDTSKKIRAGSITKKTIKLKSREKPELRKGQIEDKKDIEKTKSHPEETSKKQDTIEDYKEQIKQIDNELEIIANKLDNAQDREIQLRKKLPIEENKLKENNKKIQDLQNRHVEFSTSVDNAKKVKQGLENTVNSLNQQLEDAKIENQEIKKKYDELISEKEEIKKTIENGEKQLEKILPQFETEINDSKEKINKKEKGLNNQKDWLNYYDSALTKEYNFKNKTDAYETLKSLSRRYIEFRKNPDSSIATDKQAENARFIIKHYKAWQAAKEIGVADSRLYKEKFDSDNEYQYQEAVEFLQKQRQQTVQLHQEIENEIQQLQNKIEKLEQQKKQLNKQFSEDPRNSQENNRKAIEKQETQLSLSNINISKLEKQKQQSEAELSQIDKNIKENEETDEDKKNYEKQLENLKEKRDIQKRIYNQTKSDLEKAQQEQIELDARQEELNEKREQILQKQKKAEEHQKELEAKQKEEERKNREEAERTQTNNKTNSETKADSEKSSTTGTTESVNTSIPPEQLQKILDLLGDIQKALGTLEDGSDVPSITQSIKSMTEALNGLSNTLGEIKQKTFNLEIGQFENNSLVDNIEEKERILADLKQQYLDFDSIFSPKNSTAESYHSDLEAPILGISHLVNKIREKNESEAKNVWSTMQDKLFPVIGNKESTIDEKIGAYKELNSILRQYALKDNVDLDKALTKNFDPNEIITQTKINTNPLTELYNILDGLKKSIDGSVQLIGQESSQFSILSGSAEEAAEAKRKFVEANKNVLQSIVASMPKIEEEAKALEKIEEIKEENNKLAESFIEDKINAEEQKRQVEEIARRKKEAQEQYENQFHAWSENGQLSFLDKNDYDLQNEYLELQKQEAEQLAKQAEQNPPKVNIPIEGQIFFTNEKDINEIADEVLYKNSFVTDENGQYSLFQDVEAASDWGQELKENLQEASKTDFSNIKNQLSLKDWETSIDETNKSVESRFKKIYNSKSFIQNTDLPDDILKTYENISTKNGEGFKATNNLRELKNLGDELKDIKTKLKVSFDEVGNLKSTADPMQVQDLLNKYDELTNKIQRLKLIISSPSSQESFLLEEFKQLAEAEKEATNNTETLKKKVQEALNKTITDKKFLSEKDVDITSLDDYFKVGSSDNLDKVRSTVEEIKILKEQLISSRDANGNIIGNPEQIQSLIDKYNNLTKVLESLIAKIKLSDSVETIGLKIAEDAEKAKKELDNLKEKVDKTLDKSGLFEAQTQKTIDIYGTFGGNGEGKRGSLIESDDLKDERFVKQQEQVQQLISKLREYKTAIQELQTLRASNDTTTEQLTKANDKVKELKDNITTLSQTIKTSGIANVSEEQIGKLKSGIESFLQRTPNLTNDVREQLEEYIRILNSGASVSKTSYNSMVADLNKFKSAQTSSASIWDLMLMKMKEGIAFLATKFSFYQIFNQFRQGFEVIHQFDDALTEMMKVSDETRTSLERYQKTTFETADAIGTSALQIQNSTADFMRLGETLDQAAESAKSANILMNVSEFQSIDEATKSLIAMGAAYDDLSKMNIIDKLNEVGNNYAISTSEAATALQASASALKTAGNDMDEALALVTAGNAVVQDATKVGTGMRTIALRLTGTKSAKEELEEMGEETENVITTQSKLRDTIKEATAVASNGFKGFDILDDNGNYKSTYEIMLGIADVYNEILETDKQFGRNNANLLLESVAGKNRANIAASIFQNPQLLRDAYQSSQEANGSAMRENDKYVQSISGHLAQLTNAWQEMWANAANRDVINFFIDAAKAAVNFANAVGVLPATLALMLPYLNIITKARSKDNKGIVTQFLDWANGINEAKKAVKEMAETQEVLNATKEAGIAISTAETTAIEAETAANVEGTAASVGKTAANEGETVSTLELTTAEVAETGAEEASTKADIEGAAASAAKSAANMGEAASEAANGVAGFGELIGGKLISGVGRFTGAIAGLASTIGAIPLLLIGAAAGFLILKNRIDAHRESVFADAKATAENIKTQQEATSQQIESYKQLKTQLDSGDLSEQETINVKQQILDIQKSITEQYGTAAQGVDLINGKLEEQVGLLNSISQKEAQDQYFKDYEGFQVAEQEYNKNNRKYTFGLNNTSNLELNQAITDVLFKNGLIDNNTGTLGLENAFATVKGTASDSINALENTKQALEELKAEYRDRDTLEALNKQIAKIEEQIGEAYEVVDKYEATALRGLELNLASNDTNGYDIYKNYQSSVSNLENAYITGDTQKINEARKAFNEATKAKNDFLKVGDNGQFALLFDKIDTSLINTKNRFRDTVELFKDIPVPEEKEGLFGGTDKKTLKDNAKAQSKLTKEQKKAYKAAEKLYKLNPDKVDIQATLKDNTYASGKYADALKALMDAMGWTTADADNLINALVTAGIVHGDAADVAYMASDSYNAFSSSVESAIGVLNTLNTALTESAKGTGLTEQTLTELRAAFGDNLDSVLEKTANGYHLNTQGAYLLRQEQEAMVNADYASSMYEQYQALNKLQEGYLKAKEAGEDTSGFVQQRQAIQNNIDKLNESLMTFNNANSAYQTWLAKQNSEGEREMYNSVYSGYDAVKDELERGWAGEKTRSWLDLIFNDENEDWDAWTSSAEKVKEKFDEVTKDIKGTGGYSIADFFTVDANGKTTSQGVWNFFDAIQNKQKEVEKEFVNLEEGWFDFTENGDYQIAEMLGMDIESVHSILRAAADAGFEIHLDQPLFSLEQLEEKAISAKKALEETTGTELKINIDPKSEGEVDDAMQKLMSYQQSLTEDTSLEPKVKTERLQQVADLLNFMAAKKREFVEGKLFDFKILDSKELEASKKNINDIVNKLSSYSKEVGKTEFSKQFAIDPMLLNNVDYLQEKINTLKEIRPNVDDTQVQYLDQLLAQLQYRVNLLNETDISGGSITVDQLMAAEQVVDDINSKLDYASKHKDIEFNWDADETFIEDLNIIANLPEEVKQKWGIDPNATGEELLELAKKGELHLQVTTSGDIPKDTTSTNTQTNNTINKTTNITEEQVNQVVTASMDTSPFDKGARHIQEENKKIDKQNPEPEVGMNSKEFKKGSDDVNKQTKELDNKKATPSVALVGKNQVINDAQAMKSAIDSVKSKTISITANFYHTGLSGMKSAIQSVLDKASELASNYTTHFANGTAHAHGTAFARGSVVSKHAYAGGKWGLPNDQTALTGELGTEIVVRDGNWFTVGENGAEFVNLKKGDIVFNHKQAQELLENGYVTSNKGRGHLVGFANGTAYSYGSSSGALRPSKTSTGMGGSTKNSGGSGGSGGSSGGNSSSNDAKETKNTLDEVEILIGRIEARISDLDKIIGSTYNTWEDRNDSILDNLKLVTQEISDQRNAYTTYMNKANSINLSESWKQKIRDGAFRIEDVTDSDLWDKIQEYQTW